MFTTLCSCLISVNKWKSFISSRRKWFAAIASTNQVFDFHTNVNTNTEADNTDNLFWMNGLSFTCTGCGGCCQNEGDTWFTTHEFCRLVNSLGLPVEDVLDIYVSDIVAHWVKMKHKLCIDTGVDQCIFLDASSGSKRCSIYEYRPIHCKTYPFWPTIVSNSTTWWNEGQVFANYYNRTNNNRNSHEAASIVAKMDGCEGINHTDSVLVSSIILQRSTQLYEAYTDDHPSNVQYSSYNSAIIERQRLINLLNEMEVKKSYLY